MGQRGREGQTRTHSPCIEAHSALPAWTLLDSQRQHTTDLHDAARRKGEEGGMEERTQRAGGANEGTCGPLSSSLLPSSPPW